MKDKYPDIEAAREYAANNKNKIPLQYLYFKRVRFFERLNNQDYDGLCQEKVEETAELFGVSVKQIWKTREHLKNIGLGRTITIGRADGTGTNKKVFISYIKIRALVKEGRLDENYLKGLAEEEEPPMSE